MYLPSAQVAALAAQAAERGESLQAGMRAALAAFATAPSVPDAEPYEVVVISGLDPALLAELRSLAAAAGCSLSRLVAEALARALVPGDSSATSTDCKTDYYGGTCEPELAGAGRR